MSLTKWIPLLIAISLTVAVDQLAKLWVVNNLVIGQSMSLVDGWQPYLQITRTTNTGIAFGIGAGGNTVVLVISLAITIGLLWLYAATKSDENLQRIGFAIVIGGALGNIIDRIRVGHVIDFVHITIPGLISNVSNFADHFVIIGVALLIIDGFLQDRRQSEPDHTDAVASTSAFADD